MWRHQLMTIDPTMPACYTVRKGIYNSFGNVAKVMHFMMTEDQNQQMLYSSYPDPRKPRYRRQEIIRDTIQSNKDNKQPPCHSLSIGSLGELLWILMICNWHGGIVESIGESGRDASWFLRSRRKQDNTALQAADLQGIIARNLDLRWANLEGALLQDADFRGTDLSSANICYTELSGTMLTSVILSDAEIISQQRADELTSLRKNAPLPPYAGVEIRSRNELLWIMRKESWSGDPEPGANKRADLRAANMVNVDFSGVDFIGADITDTILLDDAEVKRLRGLAAENRRNERPLYYDVPIRERRALLWIMQEERWSGDPEPGDYANADLRGADFRHAQLANADLEKADLSRAKLECANLNGARLGSARLVRVTGQFAQLQNADLKGARLDHSQLKSADFRGADLLGARATNMQLEQACFRDAGLSVANVCGTDFRGADLRGSDIRGAKVNAATSFIDVELDNRVHLGDIVWFGNPLTQIDWDKASTIGDECDIEEAVGNDRAIAYRDAIRAYRGLWIALRRQGIVAPASRYRLREKRLERSLLWEQGKWFQSFASLRADLVAGYGEQPWKSLVMFCLIVLLYTGLYWVVANIPWSAIPATDHTALNIFDSLKLSLSAFQGRTQQMGPVTFFLGISETLLGAYVLLAFTVLNTQKILGKPE